MTIRIRWAVLGCAVASAWLLDCGSDDGGGSSSSGDLANGDASASSSSSSSGGSTSSSSSGGSTSSSGGIDAGKPGFTVGGSVTGLTGLGDAGAPDAGDGGAPAALVLQNDAKDDLTIKTNGAFTFATKLAQGSSYAVTVKTQPDGHACTVDKGTGTIASNVTDVAVTCVANQYTVSIDVTGMNGKGLVATLDGGNDKTVDNNGVVAFTPTLAYGASFDVAIKTLPTRPTATCTVNGGTGVVTGNTTVAVTCTDDPLSEATYAMVDSVTATGPYLPISFAWDGTYYWIGYGGDAIGDRLRKVDANLAAFNALASYQTSRDYRSIFTKGGEGAQLYSRAFASATIETIDVNGVVAAFATLQAPVPAGDSSVVWNEAGTELVALSPGGTVRRWQADGTALPAVTLTGFGTLTGEDTNGANTHLVVTSGYYLTITTGSVLSAWSKDGTRVKSATLTAALSGQFPTWTFSYANKKLWFGDWNGTTSVWRSFDVGL
jgi:hypothetical protein